MAYPNPEALTDSPLQAMRSRLAVDDFLRDELHLFVIWERRTGRPILWKRHGRIYTQDKALAIAQGERLLALKKLEKRK